MSVSTSALAKELKQILGVQTNTEVLERVKELQSPTSTPVIVAVRWQPGELAGVSVLSGHDVPLAYVAEALRRGEAVVTQQLEQMAVQAQNEAARLRAQLDGGKCEP